MDTQSSSGILVIFSSYLSESWWLWSNYFHNVSKDLTCSLKCKNKPLYTWDWPNTVNRVLFASVSFSEDSGGWLCREHKTLQTCPSSHDNAMMDSWEVWNVIYLHGLQSKSQLTGTWEWNGEEIQELWEAQLVIRWFLGSSFKTIYRFCHGLSLWTAFARSKIAQFTVLTTLIHYTWVRHHFALWPWTLYTFLCPMTLKFIHFQPSNVPLWANFIERYCLL